MEDFLQEAYDELYVRVYGTETLKIKDISTNTLSQLGHHDGGLNLVKVIALGIGLNSNSFAIVDPFYLIVSGTGKKTEPDKYSFPEDVKIWTMKKDAVSVRLHPTTGTVEKLIEDYGPLDLKVKPTLSARLKQRGDTQICIEYTYSVKAYYKIFGSGWNEFLSISDSGSECIGFDSCIEIVKNDFVTGDLCYYLNENKICLKLSVGYRGVRVKVTECVIL